MRKIKPAYTFKANAAILFLLIFMSLSVSLKGQEDFIIQNLKLEKGLSQSSVWAFTQDKKGFIWVGTQDGLNRYDGYKYKVYKHIPFDSSSLSSNFISALTTDKSEKIWVGTSLEGLDLFDPRTQKCIHFGANTPGRRINSNDIRSLLTDRYGYTWVGTTNGINRIVQQTGAQNRFDIQSWQLLNAAIPRQSYINTMMEDNTGKIWLGTRAGLFFVTNNSVNKTLSNVNIVRTDTHQFAVTSLVQDNTGRVWVGSNKGLFWYDASSKKLIPFGEDILGQATLIESICVDSYNMLWVASAGTENHLIGLKLANLPYSREWIIPRGYSLNNANRIQILQESKTQKGIMWIGTYSDGLLKMTPADYRFFSEDLQNVPGLGSRQVNAIYKDGDKLWIGTGKGLVLKRESKGTVQLFNQKSGLPQKNTQDIRSIHKDGNGNLWLLTLGGVFKIAEKGENVSFEPVKVSECTEGPVIYCYEDSEHNVYFSNGKGINIYNPLTKKTMPCSIIPDSVLNKSNRVRIYALLRDAKDRFWIGTSTGVLLIRDFRNPEADLAAGRCIHLKHEVNNPASLRSNIVLTIHEDMKGNIWLGTTDGLVMVKDNGKTITFDNYSESEGLLSSTIYGIQEDSVKKHLWMSTNGGIFRFHLITHRFENYDENDGLQSNEFNEGAYDYYNGEMFFGGIRGYTRFFPSRIKADTITPYVSITDILIRDNIQKELLYDTEKKVSLDYGQNTFIVNFLGIQHIKTEDLHYFYALEKQSEENKKREWIYLGTNHQVNFSNLAPGNYNFYVTGSTNHLDDYKNGTTDKLIIEILPPFWQRAWFYALILLGLGTSLWLLHQYRVQQNIRRVMDMERVRKNAAADFHDELGHKLTVISLFANVVKNNLQPEQNKLIPHLEKVIDTSNSLYLSMKDLLWVLDPKKDSLYDLVLMLKDFGDQLFDKTGVAFRADGIDESMRGYNLQMHQKRHITLIFKEVMNNAMKHSRCQNTLLSFVWDEETYKLVIRFKDDGKGFNPNDTNSGNGLLNLTDRANKVEGTINVLSGNGTIGTEVIFEIVFTQFSDANSNIIQRVRDYFEGKTYFNGKSIRFFKKDRNYAEELEKIK